MNVLANSLRRIRSAKDHVLHLTGWGTFGLLSDTPTKALAGSVYEGILALTELAQRSTPTILVILWSIFR